MTENYHLGYTACRDLLERRLDEKAPGRIQLLAGPRQVGKTTLLLELSKRLGESALYIAADGPEAALPGYWDGVWSRAERIAGDRGKAVVLLDEIQNQSDWASRLKVTWDRLRRLAIPVHIIATGSSALHVGSGARESLAGRFERLVLTHWTASSLVSAFRIPAAEAVDIVVRMGSYPGAIGLRQDLPRWAAYVRDSIVEPAIGRDLVALAPVRRPALLRQVFAVCATSPAQIVSLQKLQGQLQDPGALETISNYLELLREAFLVAPLPKHASTAARRRASPPKLVILSNAFLAVMDHRGIPSAKEDPSRFGAWLENGCLAHAVNSGQRVTYWREEPLEVDAVTEGSWGSWVLEIKSGPVTVGDLKGLLEFARRHPKYRPLLVCEESSLPIAERTNIDAITYPEFLLSGPPKS